MTPLTATVPVSSDSARIRVAARPEAVAARRSAASEADAAPSVVALDRVSVEFAGKPALRQVSLTIARGECVAVLGCNGAGKSTLLRVMATLLAATEGSVRHFDAAPDNARAPRPDIRASIGFVGHAPMLYEELSALENLRFFGRLHRVPDVEVRSRAMLEALGLVERADDRVGALSRGMVRRVALARALLHRPELVLLDEPFSGLDADATARVRRVLAGARAHGATVVLTGHGPGPACDLASSVAVLREGSVALRAPTRACTPEQIVSAIGACGGET